MAAVETKVKTGSAMMTQQEILETIRDYEQTVRERYQIVRLGIFGSAARDEMTEESDIDVVVEIGKPDLFAMVAIKQDLEELLATSIDIVRYRHNMNPELKRRIDLEAQYV